MPKSKKVPGRDRVVYEVTAGPDTHRIEARTADELSHELTSLLPGVEPYSVRALARVAALEQADIIAPTWAVRRTGVMRFHANEAHQPDPPRQPTRKPKRNFAAAAPPAKPPVDVQVAERVTNSIDDALEFLIPPPQEVIR